MEHVNIDIIIGVTKNYLWKYGIQTAISSMPGYAIAGEYASGVEILSICRNQAPKLLLLDQELMDMSANELHDLLVSENIHIPILLIGSSNTIENDIIDLFQCGIKGYILNNCTEEQIIDAITHVSKNMEWCSPTCSPRLFNNKRSTNNIDTSSKKITHREHEILNLMFKGHNNTEISDVLCLSINTVQNHICNIYSKFGVRERLKAVNYAKREGLIDL
ncbi:response regulator transcription factor [Paenibacillus endoradicis]|uniref:response regulator transcription factor n=1 Tax=Paenibacillus endoradicis TaxID=2972487 RepID=UPI002159099D|nr:response regulator transcription factor [Paenibacillus endoradicis]MCR8657750.1 response regulator transcription factor [Paenibacillus endoradicis]